MRRKDDEKTGSIYTPEDVKGDKIGWFEKSYHVAYTGEMGEGKLAHGSIRMTLHRWNKITPTIIKQWVEIIKLENPKTTGNVVVTTWKEFD